ncbi:TRAP transporter substrate-binding protein DctP [Agrococcus carbonis]|uniref:TRAP-type C4-dicarboxylate transport system, substrate-binding protein n=1 Tax=Agrococcus carbonis TaxID=684552 RepID=A0A1H1PTB9_9MICO|nr:TRAP transporter substrate-binding protein DctP [Agrococcus carbonis]SDS14343.1 TRAP-type C4-dicarboxylate transport system, substrate-binding protein [Agrococcus carbonis]
MKNFKRAAAVAAAGMLAISMAACSSGGPGGSSAAPQGDGEARQLQLATYLGPETPYGAALQWAVDELEQRSEGDLTIEVYWEGALLGGPDVLSGVAQGRADMGLTTPNYSPAELPLTQIMTLPFVTSDVAGVQDAFMELYSSNEAYQAEWNDLGLHMLNVQAVTPVIMLGRDAPSGYDWIAGKSLRATSLMGNAVQAAGGNPVALALPEVYESAQRGLIDGVTSLNLGTVPSTSLQELVPHVADPGAGIYSLTNVFINQSTYDSLSADQQSVLDEVMLDMNDEYLSVLQEFDTEACDLILEAGGSVTIWDESETQEWADAVGETAFDSWLQAAGPDGQAFYDEYLSLVESSEGSADYVDGMAACADRD